MVTGTGRESHESGVPEGAARWRFIARPSPLAAVFTCAVIVVMIALGLFIIDRYRTLQLQSYGKIGSVHIDNLLAPYALALQREDTGVTTSMEQMFRDLTNDNSQISLRIWKLDGSLHFSTIPADRAAEHQGDDLRDALEGGFVAELETEGTLEPGFPMTFPFFEVYAPIYDPATGAMIAAGEMYQNADEILDDRAFVERMIWAAIAFVTLGVLALLGLSFGQSALLRDRLAAEQRMAEQNRRLRRAADRARLDAAQANEQVLNLIGAELHDGPVQLLGLMSLMDGNGAKGELADGTTRRSLTDRVMTELRAMSAGLILPELDGLDAAQIVRLAIARHEALTGEKVEPDLSALPIPLDPPRRVCLYRVVQEGLTNASRHGGGTVPKVSLLAHDDHLDVTIISGASKDVQPSPRPETWKLGLRGMSRRLEAFGGKLFFESGDDKARLNVRLPIGPA